MVSEPLLFGDAGGTGDESIVSPGKLVFASSAGGGGLSDISVDAEEIVLLQGAIVSTRSIAGGDPRTAPSTADSGDVTFEAERIALGKAAAIVAHGDSGFAGGNVELSTSSVRATSFDLFRVVGAEAVVEIGLGALVTGYNITLAAVAETSAPAHLGDVVDDLYAFLPAGAGLFAALSRIVAELTFLPVEVRSRITTVAGELEAAEVALRAAIESDGLFDLPAGVVANGVFGKSDARVEVSSGGRIVAGGNARLRAGAVSSVSVTTLAADGYLGLSYASSEPSALVLLRTGAVVDSAGDVELRATTETTLALAHRGVERRRRGRHFDVVRAHARAVGRRRRGGRENRRGQPDALRREHPVDRQHRDLGRLRRQRRSRPRCGAGVRLLQLGRGSGPRRQGQDERRHHDRGAVA